MASTSRKAGTTKSILKPVMTLKGHGEYIRCISYFPDGQQMISRSDDKTAWRWDLMAGKEIEEARGVCEEVVYAVAVSRDGRLVVTAGGDFDFRPELKACEVQTGMMKTFEGHSGRVTCIDISADSKLLASRSFDCTTWIWHLDTGKLVAGPFWSFDWVGAVRFLTDSKKLAIKSHLGKCLEVWDVQSQKLDVMIEKQGGHRFTYAPVFWTNKNKNILAAFTFNDDPTKTIYEFDVSMLEPVGTPFEGHTKFVAGIALSSDYTLLASASYDNTIKLWAFESRQLLASFDVQNPDTLVLSPNSRKLAYMVFTYNDNKIYICNTPPNVLAQARHTSAHKKSTLNDLPNSDALRRHPPAVRCRPPIPVIPMTQRPPPTINPKQPISLRLRQLLRFSPQMNAVHPIQPRNTLDFEISSPPPPSNGPVKQFLRQHIPFLVPSHGHMPPDVEVAPGRKFTRLAAANLPEYKKVDDTRHPPQAGEPPQDIDSSDNDSLPDVHWMPPRWRLVRVDIPRQNSTTNGNRSSARGRG
ncbi:hypothetical protein DEU56DRAFT_919388 [Suillus clintonianus]|uniref:uncharacterized protein n=1 Tax=Suillus clintonianus TaxID=1904413 RepID=UPI001B871C5B|nr:uncharacterized protein DEU56DRAFT_919388 [Suillus clintonianus]KAG2115477.1 hypothetical protein DEU56DRAFT_919388 [Suillus clintonianus]